MGADAKMWPEKNDGRDWKGHHDGLCTVQGGHDEIHLADLVTSIEACMGGPLRWEFREMTDGTEGVERIVLFGYRA